MAKDQRKRIHLLGAANLRDSIVRPAYGQQIHRVKCPGSNEIGIQFEGPLELAFGPADLARHECLVVGGPRTVWSFTGGVRVPVGGRLRMDSFRLARALAVRGVGITRTARMFAAQAEAAGELVPVLEPHWPKSTLYAVHAGTSPPEPKVQAVLALLREAIPRALART